MSNPPTHSVRAYILHFLWRQKWKFILIQLFALVWSLDHTLWPYVFKVIIDRISSFQGPSSELWSYLSGPLWAGALLWLSIEAGFRLSGIIAASAIPKCEADIRMHMFEYIQHHSYQYFTDNFAGAIGNKIADMATASTRIIQLVVTLFIPAFVALVIAIGFFTAIHPFFALILISWVTVHLAICAFYAKPSDKASEIHAESRSQLTGAIIDSLGNHVSTRLFAQHRHEYDTISQFQFTELRTHITALWVVERMKIFLGIACFLSIGVLMTWYVLYSWQLHRLTIGDVVMIFNMTWHITLMAWLAGLELPNLYKEIGVCRQALSVVRAPHTLTDAPGATQLHVSKGEIRFEHVSFHYVRNHNIFQDKSLTIMPGEKVGLVGFSGSGKTTFAHLILRLFDIKSGQILIDGQDIQSVTQDSLHRNIAMISQDTSLFHRNLLDNIRYGRISATDEDVYQAAKLAHCDEFIEKLPEKYQTQVGERGIKLSGGQRQRIAIARAILKNAPILMLDEATSALDSVTESYIQESLSSLMNGRTTIVIAHRLSTLTHMDRILVFKNGSIIQDGSHQALLEAPGHYRTLWEMQAGGLLPESAPPSELFS